MKYQLPCKCGRSVEVEPVQAGQAVVCSCGENLLVPSMLQVKTLSAAPAKQEPPHRKKHVPYRAVCVNLIIALVCLVLAILFRLFEEKFVAYRLYVLFSGLSAAFFSTSIVLTVRERIRSPLAADTALRRTFFVLGIALLFPASLLAPYLYAWKPHPMQVAYKEVYKSYGSYQRLLYQNSTPILLSEHTILRMRNEDIDHMFPMELFLHFQTLEHPTFSYNFQDNYEAVKATYHIWVTVNVILFILAIASIIASFFMPKQTVAVTGWSGSEWQ